MCNAKMVLGTGRGIGAPAEALLCLSGSRGCSAGTQIRLLLGKLGLTRNKSPWAVDPFDERWVI